MISQEVATTDWGLALEWLKALTPAIGAVAGLLSAYVGFRNLKKVEQAKTEIKEIKKTTQRTTEEFDLMRTGAHWKGYAEGAADERKGNTDFGKLKQADWKG